MSLPLPYYASRLMPLPNEVADYSNTGLRRLQETLDICIFLPYSPSFRPLARQAAERATYPVDRRPR